MSGFLRQFCRSLNYFCHSSSNATVQKVFNTPRILSSCDRFYSNVITSHEVVDQDEDKIISAEVIKNVSEHISEGKQGRLFAVVHLAGKQFKITEGDLLIIEGYWPPNVGDKISLDKVLLLGGSDFTLVGRPLIQSGLANVYATVIEKMLSHTKTHFRKKRRKQYKKIHFYRIQQTMLRINKVELVGQLNKPPEVSGLDYVIL